MKFRRYPQRVKDEQELFPELVDTLLEGWGGPIRPEHTSEGAFRVFDCDLHGIWQRHRPRLLAEADRRGLPRPIYAETFDCPNWPVDLDWQLAAAALHGTAAPEWARGHWDAEKLAGLRQRLLALLDDDGRSAA